MWKWLILALACYVLYRLFANDVKKKLAKKDDPVVMEQKVAAGELVKDPSCGTYIDADSGITVKDGESIHRFCSYDCRDAFLKKLQNGGRVLPDDAVTNPEEQEKHAEHDRE